MNKKLFFIIALAMALTIAVPIISVQGQGIPNPDHIYVVSFGGPETVDPAWAYDTASGELIQNIFEPLCAFDGESTTDFIAKLADWWPGYDTNPGHAISPSPPDPSAPSGTHETWYFHIRPNVKFHDGSILTPYDVEYSFERALLMDHSGGPMWMIYEPLLGVMGSSAYDANENGIIDQAEYVELENDIKNAIGANDTYVWFNLPEPYAPFQQILTQSWGMILSKNYAIAHGCWNGQYGNYNEFLRCYDPPSPGPLMDPEPEAMGTGPYKLKAINTDPHAGWYVLERFDDYWGGPAPTQYVTVKNVEEWSNRKAQFFSTDPALQADFCAVPRANIRELHVGGNKDGPTYPGFRMYKVPVQAIGAVYFVYDVSQPSDYTPKLGATPKPDLFSDRNMRLLFMYALNVTKFIEEYWLGEAEQPTTCMPPGTAFYNSSKPIRNIDLAKAQAALDAAWGGQVKAQGITVKVTYNAGNTARETIAKMLEDVIEHRLQWGSGAVVDIIPTGVPWSTYLVDMYTGKLSVFIIGWLADYPDPHDWFMPFMHSEGDYSGVSQGVVYGLGNIAASWPTGASYGPPPYTNYLGETVTSINNTYVDHLIETALGLPPAGREAVYNELMDIFYAEALTHPVYFSFGRHYERTWISGWYGTWNSNPISPGLYFYTIRKVPAGAVHEVDISAVETITNITVAYPLIQVYHGEMRLNGKAAMINYSIHIVYKTGDVDVWVLLALLREDEAGNFYFPFQTIITLSPGEEYTAEISWYESSTMAPGNWTISLYAVPSGVPGGEVVDPDPTNNKAASPFKVKAKEFPEDLDGSGKVDIKDIYEIAKAFGSKEGDKRWNARADINGDLKVDIKDIFLVAKMFGKTIFEI